MTVRRIYNEVQIIRPSIMVLVESDLHSEQVSFTLKLHFGTGTSDLNGEGGAT